jgi:hypothetical protein
VSSRFTWVSFPHTMSPLQFGMPTNRLGLENEAAIRGDFVVTYSEVVLHDTDGLHCRIGNCQALRSLGIERDVHLHREPQGVTRIGNLDASLRCPPRWI